MSDRQIKNTKRSLDLMTNQHLNHSKNQQETEPKSSKTSSLSKHKKLAKNKSWQAQAEGIRGNSG